MHFFPSLTWTVCVHQPHSQRSKSRKATPILLSRSSLARDSAVLIKPGTVDRFSSLWPFLRLFGRLTGCAGAAETCEFDLLPPKKSQMSQKIMARWSKVMNKTWKCVQTDELITLLCPWKALILSDERAHGVLNTVQSLGRLRAAFGLRERCLDYRFTATSPENVFGTWLCSEHSMGFNFNRCKMLLSET